MSNKFLYFPLFGLLLPFLVYIFLTNFFDVAEVVIEPVGEVVTSGVTVAKQSAITDGKSDEIIFLGDILLARHVEYLISTLGVEYPFKNSSSIFGNATVIFGNFESAVLERHVKTPSYVTTFSVDKKYLPLLKQAGITHVSLANNHSFDYGSTTFSYTKNALSESGVAHFGHPKNSASDTSVTFTSGSYTIGVLALNQIFSTIDWEVTQSQITKLASTSDYQIVYIHWGEEYSLKHNSTQELLAKKIIDAGIDAVIGHHPHVTQDIEIYNNKPIFYSLGNFLFDQYFSVDVQQGLALSLKLSSSAVQYELIPVSSEGAKSQPYKMSDPETKLFLTNLARRSSPNYSDNIKAGMLILPLSLATSP